MTENESIEWDQFQSKFYRLEPGNQAEVGLTRWRQRERSFMENEKPRTALCFDVIGADDTLFDPPKEWSTTSPVLAAEFRPMIEKAILQSRTYIKVILKRTSDKKYIVIDISDPTTEKKYQGLKK